MSKYRNRLPQLREGLFATDAGLETTLIFHQGLELSFFAAFDQKRLPALAVVGGCCGTDHRHVAAICDALMADKDSKASRFR